MGKPNSTSRIKAVSCSWRSRLLTAVGETILSGLVFPGKIWKTGNKKAQILAETLDEATGLFLDNDKSPMRNAGELDNRGSHFYLAMYWAQALAEQDKNTALKTQFTKLAQQLIENEVIILEEFKAAQGHPVEMGGYYHPDIEKTTIAMRPSTTLNEALASVG